MMFCKKSRKKKKRVSHDEVEYIYVRFDDIYI